VVFAPADTYLPERCFNRQTAALIRLEVRRGGARSAMATTKGIYLGGLTTCFNPPLDVEVYSRGHRV